MKVLDLQCANAHTFEGWFASEEDYVAQCGRSLVQCPICDDASISKKLSAPRLNLTSTRSDAVKPPEVTTSAATVPSGNNALTAAWLAFARELVANTTDVGERFADEARKIHYGETEARSIRGKATASEAQELADEGIEVMPFVLPQALKEPLQ